MMKWHVKRYVKKILLIAFLIFAFRLLFRIWHGPKDYQFGQDTAQIASIEIVSGFGEQDALAGEYEKRTVIALIPQEKWDDFMNDFRQVDCYNYLNDPCLVFGDELIFITYEDGAVEIISDFTTFYHAVGKRGDFRPYYFDNEQYKALIKTYREERNRP